MLCLLCIPQNILRFIENFKANMVQLQNILFWHFYFIDVTINILHI